MKRFPTVEGPTTDNEPALAALVSQLTRRHHDRVLCVLAYGSCLRGGDIYDGLLDLYLIVENYKQAHSNPLSTLANWLLPPNVYYAEQEHQGRTLRCKYAVVSKRDFEDLNSDKRFESYFWGRFAQPVGVVWQHQVFERSWLESVLLTATTTFLAKAVPAIPAQGTTDTLWSNALALSYNTELRTERSGRSEELALHGQDHFRQISELVELEGLSIKRSQNELLYSGNFSDYRRRIAHFKWRLRTVFGKLLSVLRLVKALFTFAGGLDYLAWKLERHSGQSIEIPENVRRMPLIFAWGFFWRLYRQGVFK